MQTNLKFLPFLMSIGFFGSVKALHCYEQGIGKENHPGRDNLKSGECTKDSTGCSAALDCGNYADMRGCTSHKDICQTVVSEGKTFRDICKHCEYCRGNLCNDKGLDKTGLKCIRKNEDFGEALVDYCMTGQAGCLAVWDCGDDEFAGSIYRCASATEKDFCQMQVPGRDGQTVSDLCSCNYCTTDFCNDGGIKEKQTIEENPMSRKTVENAESNEEPQSGEGATAKTGGKPKHSSVENTQPSQEVEPNSMEEPKPDSIEVQDSTPKTDVAKPNGEANATEAPPNGAAGIVVGGIILIGMMLLAWCLAPASSSKY